MQTTSIPCVCGGHHSGATNAPWTACPREIKHPGATDERSTPSLCNRVTSSLAPPAKASEFWDNNFLSTFRGQTHDVQTFQCPRCLHPCTGTVRTCLETQHQFVHSGQSRDFKATAFPKELCEEVLLRSHCAGSNQLRRHNARAR